MKLRKGRWEAGGKVCRKCGQDYNEANNFNWSCRTHPSEYSGEIYWCCGKRGKLTPGCKFQKHEQPDDGEEDEIQLVPEEKLRCMCCKTFGHKIEACPRDPNLKTKIDSDTDYERIQKISDFKKLYGDSTVQTTHFLKKCVLQPSKKAVDSKQIIMKDPFKSFIPFVKQEEEKAVEPVFAMQPVV